MSDGLSRRGDPITASEAGRKLRSKRIMQRMTTLFDSRRDGYTCTEMEVATGIKRDTLTPRIRKLREDGKIAKTNQMRRFGDRPGETYRSGQHRHCTVYKSTDYATREEIIPIKPPSLLDELVMKATSSKHLHMTASLTGWTGRIDSLNIIVFGKYQGAVRSAAKAEVRAKLRPLF